MKFKSHIRRMLFICCAVALMATALVVPAMAGSIQDQMAANSAAWHIANAAGDTATCNALHEANVALAAQAAAGGGNASYNANSGTWNITTNTGSTISSGSSQDGKQTTATYTTTSSSGSVSYASVNSYSDYSINSYYNYGGNDYGLQTAYNNSAAYVTSNNAYGSQNARNDASGEVAVAKKLLGLSDAEARQLQNELESSKQAYDTAQKNYERAIRYGNTASAARYKAQMDAAHDAAQATRAKYNYTGDVTGANDGGYYTGKGKSGYSSSDGGGFFVGEGNITVASYKISASNGAGGSISPSGTTTVQRGKSQSYSISPSTGYKVKSVAVDGSNVGAVTSYTFSNVTSDHNISANFEKLTYTISASAGKGGSISPSGTSTVSYGESRTYTISTNWGYKVASVTVDGRNVGEVTSYTFSNVTSAHSISVTFVPNGVITLNPPSIESATGLNASSNTMKSGYGLTANVNAPYSNVKEVSVTMSYNFGEGPKTVTLEETSTGHFEFPVNPASKTGARSVYIPVNAPDGTYVLTYTMTAKNAADEVLTKTVKYQIVVKGSMYEDDFTGAKR